MCHVLVDYEYHTYKDYGAGYDYYGGYEQQDDYGMYGHTAYSEPAAGRGRGVVRRAAAFLPRGITNLSLCVLTFNNTF